VFNFLNSLKTKSLIPSLMTDNNFLASNVTRLNKISEEIEEYKKIEECYMHRYLT
jgi:hypothetical protein